MGKRARTEKKVRRDIAGVLNRHCLDSKADTPYFILAELVLDCLSAHRKAKKREKAWRGSPKRKQIKHLMTVDKMKGYSGVSKYRHTHPCDNPKRCRSG